MSRREIIASQANSEGDYVRVVKPGNRGAGAIVGALIGSAIAPGVGTVLGGMAGAAGGQDAGVVFIHKKDIIEIKTDSSGKVTSVVYADRSAR